MQPRWSQRIKSQCPFEVISVQAAPLILRQVLQARFET